MHGLTKEEEVSILLILCLESVSKWDEEDAAGDDTHRSATDL